MATLAVRDAVAAMPMPQQAWVQALIERAGAPGIALYVVGGPVRDLLLGRALGDVDLMVEPADLDRVEALLRALARDAGGLQVVRHERFGTLTLRGEGAALDVAMARSEQYAQPGALPRVAPGGVQQDLERRDFTVNALALPLCGAAVRSDGQAEVLAVPGALRDLRERRLCVLHPRSFHDDPTRALRAARLAPRLGFSLSRATRAALRDALRDGAFGAVSGDRYRREIERLFADAALGLDPVQALRCLGEWHVLAALEPGLELPRQAQAPLRRLGRALAQPPWRFARHRVHVPGFMLWLAPLRPAMRRRVLARLAVRGEAARRIVGFARARDTWLAQLGRARGRGAVDGVLGDVDEESLLALYASAPTASLRRRIARWAIEDRSRRTPISGTELVALGLGGPAVGRVLARVRGAFLDGEIANREEALALAAELARRSLAASEGRAGRAARARRAAARRAAVRERADDEARD